MTLAIMQPYLFPYLGYFQLIAAADRFVFLDDVAFIKKGWIHRNRILVNGAAHTFTVPITDASQNRAICETRVAAAFDPAKLLRTIELNYRKAPYFAAAYEIASAVFSHAHETISEMAKHSVRAVCGYLALSMPLIESSARYGNAELRGAERIRDITVRENAARYINPVGGTELYNEADFAAAGIELRFVKSRPHSYAQFGAPFVPWLSILDVLMFNSTAETRALLAGCDLVRACELPS